MTLSVQQIRELLGEEGIDLSNEEVFRIREVEYGLADAIFEKWLRTRNARTGAREVESEAMINLPN